jgi:SAM-dependent methyltransferase
MKNWLNDKLSPGQRRIVKRTFNGMKNLLGATLILDVHPKRNWRGGVSNVSFNCEISKEDLTRKILFDLSSGGKFIDIGGRDGKLSYMLGVRQHHDFDPHFYEQNKMLFDQKFEYFGWDIVPQGPNVIVGDICAPDAVAQNLRGTFDIVYSNHVFEHLEKPWVAAQNCYDLLKPGGICITIAPFSVRYHAVPGDYFRFSHEGMESLFRAVGPIEVIECGYDILSRRDNSQGIGVDDTKDLVPTDSFGAWRETWHTFLAFRKPWKDSAASNA